MASALYVKDPATSRFIAGSLAEAESLLGSPLPVLPPPDHDAGRPVFAVRFHPQLHRLLDRFLQSLVREIGGEGGRGDSASRDQAEYENAMGRVLRAVRADDRRLGLVNLCWLAHSKAVAESLRDLQQKNPAVRQLKYSLHPLLSSFFRRLDQAARRAVEQANPQRAALLAGGAENTSLVDSLIDDGFAFTEMGIANVDFNQFLAANKRYRLGADLFFEIYTQLVKETDRRLRENERGMVARLARHFPGLTREQSLSHAGLVKVMMNAHVLTYLLGDAWQTGSKLQASPRIKAEVERRRPAEILDAFLDVVTGVKRFEIVSHLRDQVCLLKADRDLDDDRASRLRLYEFGESAQVINNAVNATVLFLDLRGFTQTSEGQISERDLTRELYEVFDAFVPHIRRFGGTVDKFLGDGIMVTYGITEADPLHPLNALRSAILCQETIRALRQQGRTYFKMGVAIHYGRVYIARFIADESSVQTTVIGRNVNMAGRLSSAAKKAIDEDEPAEGPAFGGPGPEYQVSVDAGGVLFNEGIAISRDTLMQLETHLPLTHTDIGGYSQMEYFDEQVGRRILIRYAGDAKFKGLRSSVPVYAVDFES